MLGEEPIAIVHLKPDHEATEGEIRAHVASKLAAFKVPVRMPTTGMPSRTPEVMATSSEVSAIVVSASLKDSLAMVGTNWLGEEGAMFHPEHNDRSGGHRGSWPD